MSSRMRVALVLGIVMGAFAAVGTASAASDIVISQVYGGGGNAGATYTHDYVELYNRGPLALSARQLSIQYASATGTGNFGANSRPAHRASRFTLQPGQYFLIQRRRRDGRRPAPDAGPRGPDSDHMRPAPARWRSSPATRRLAATGAAASRATRPHWRGSWTSLATGTRTSSKAVGAGADAEQHAGCAPCRQRQQDTDNNAADFAAATPNPRNSVVGDAAPSVSSSSPIAGATGVARDANVVDHLQRAGEHGRQLVRRSAARRATPTSASVIRRPDDVHARPDDELRFRARRAR